MNLASGPTSNRKQRRAAARQRGKRHATDVFDMVLFMETPVTVDGRILPLPGKSVEEVMPKAAQMGLTRLDETMANWTDHNLANRCSLFQDAEGRTFVAMACRNHMDLVTLSEVLGYTDFDAFFRDFTRRLPTA